MNKKQYIIIFDADNTLWDTNAIFYASQVAMLKPFERAGYLVDAKNNVGELRKLDRLLMQQFEKHEYDFRFLSKALALHFIEGLNYEIAASEAVSREENNLDPSIKEIIEESYQDYTKSLTKVPSLLPNVLDILLKIKNLKTGCSDIVSILFSEGIQERLNRIMKDHAFAEKAFFNDYMIGPKSKYAFECARDLGLKYLKQTHGSTINTIVIGDSLKRDIIPANEAGFTTIYIPSNFQGVEIPKNKLEEPTYQIENISQLVNVFNKLGLTIPCSQIC